MKIAVVAARELTDELVAAWSSIQSSDARFDSPFFRPEYVQAVSAVRADVKVAVVHDPSGAPVAFFPYQENHPGEAVPVGDNLCDFEAVISRPDAQWTVEEILRAGQLRAWRFGHVITAQHELQGYHWKLADSPYADLSSGYEAYCVEKKKAGWHTFKETNRKARKLERSTGKPLRFIPHTSDPHVFDQVIQWKRQQYRRIRSVDQLEQPWTIDVLRQIARTQTPDFAGMVSALYCGDDLIAAHLGMLSRGVFHAWFPVYNDDFSQASPGILFWFKLLENADSLGIRRLDFGKGQEEFKQHLMTGSVTVAEGSVDYRWIAGAWRRTWFNTREWVRRSPLKAPAKSVVGTLRSFRHSWSHRREAHSSSTKAAIVEEAVDRILRSAPIQSPPLTPSADLRASGANVRATPGVSTSGNPTP